MGTAYREQQNKAEQKADDPVEQVTKQLRAIADATTALIACIDTGLDISTRFASWQWLLWSAVLLPTRRKFNPRRRLCRPPLSL